MKARALVVGFGSIGERHIRVLEELGLDVHVVSRRGESGNRPVFRTIAEALDRQSYDYGVIANETGLHAQALGELAEAGFDGTILVEKPLASRSEFAIEHNRFRRIGVGYNLRFHPVARRIFMELNGAHVEMANFHVGQWLADWRPNRPLASTYSSSMAAGGGVLRDLSHELDLALWLFGPWTRVAAIGGRMSNITRDADDGWGILLVCERCPLVTIHLNCLDRRGRRTVTVQSNANTLHGDFVKGSFEDAQGSHALPSNRDEIYTAMHASLIEGTSSVCSFEEGMEVVRLIEAIEQASKEQRWITRK